MTKMRPARSIPDYLRRPLGFYYLGSAFLHFFVDRTLCGILLFGRADASAIAELTRALAVELPECAPPHALYVDARRLTGVSAAAWQPLADFAARRGPELRRNVTRQALVRPAGVPGALAVGFYEALDAAPYAEPGPQFADSASALAWLGRSDAEPLLLELDEAAAATVGASPLRRTLHEQILARPDQATLAAVAQRLGLSARALQRQLQAAGTTFPREARAARVAAAKSLLVESRDQLSEVALAVGCPSPSHFSRMFTAAAGCSPSEWRILHRR